MPGSDIEAGYPSDAALRHHLRELLKVRGATAPHCEITEREPLELARTHPSERVVCLVDGRREELYCKYGGHSDAAHLRHGHRHGIRYEAAVYEHTLRAIDLPIARFRGAVESGESTWLVMDYLNSAGPVSRTGIAGALSEAGRWLGSFHRQSAVIAVSPAAEFLYRHSAAHYLGCAERTLEFAAPLITQYPWLAAAANRYAEWAVPQLLAEQAVIHGEFYSSNVLYRDGEVVPVDWESAAVGAPEIDLAFLLEGWSDADRTSVIEAYASARWPNGSRPDISSRLQAATMFSQFRWLGDRPEWTVDRENRWRFKILRECAGTGA